MKVKPSESCIIYEGPDMKTELLTAMVLKLKIKKITNAYAQGKAWVPQMLLHT